MMKLTVKLRDFSGGPMGGPISLVKSIISHGIATKEKNTGGLGFQSIRQINLAFMTKLG